MRPPRPPPRRPDKLVEDCCASQTTSGRRRFACSRRTPATAIAQASRPPRSRRSTPSRAVCGTGATWRRRRTRRRCGCKEGEPCKVTARRMPGTCTCTWKKKSKKAPPKDSDEPKKPAEPVTQRTRMAVTRVGRGLRRGGVRPEETPPDSAEFSPPRIAVLRDLGLVLRRSDRGLAEIDRRWTTGLPGRTRPQHVEHARRPCNRPVAHPPRHAHQRPPARREAVDWGPELELGRPPRSARGGAPRPDRGAPRRELRRAADSPSVVNATPRSGSREDRPDGGRRVDRPSLSSGRSAPRGGGADIREYLRQSAMAVADLLDLALARTRSGSAR